MAHYNHQALITGSSKRIGREMSIFLAQKGYDLVLHYNNSKTDTELLAQDLKTNYPNQIFEACYFNLADWENVAEIWETISPKFQNVNLLINNASVYYPMSLRSTKNTNLIENFALHVFAPYMLIKTFAERNSNGQVINIIDSAINNNISTHAPYLLSKKSLANLTQMAAFEFAPNIRVNGISPGAVLPAGEDSNFRFKQIVSQTPLQIEVSISNLLATLNFLISNNNLTGQIINVDSGSHLGNKNQ